MLMDHAAVAGEPEVAAPATILRSGRLSAVLTSDGAVRELRVDGGPSLVGVGFLVRDAGWGTVPGEVACAEVGAASARMSGRHRGPGIDLAWDLAVDVSETGLAYRVSGRALADSTVNRVGLVALHPAAWAGLDVVVDHADGSSERSRFPELVAPWQPFSDVSGFDVATARGHVHVRFAGDAFETEDQRNWSDASFKTYSRPLALPFPYVLAAGGRFEQAVTVDVALPAGAARPRPHPVTVRPGGQVALPALGLCAVPDEDLGPYAADLAGLAPAWLRVDVLATADGLVGRDRLEAVAAAGIPVEVAVHVAGGDAGRGLDELAAVLGGLAEPPAAVLALDADHPATTASVAAVVRAAVGPAVPLLVGTDDNLAELNRNRVDPASVGADGVVFSSSPQVHDDDPAAVCATSDSLAAMVATARSFAHGAVEVGPLTLRPRRNIHAPGAVDRLGRDAGSVDPRQHTPLAAAWLLASLAALAAAGVERVTLGEVSGARGLAPAPGVGTPAGDVVAAVRRASVAREVVANDDALRGLDLDGVTWLANRSREPIEVRLRSRTLAVPPLGVAVAR
jgi:hypothetical protein